MRHHTKRRSFETKTANFTVSALRDVYFLDPATGAASFTATLPPAATCVSKVLRLARIDDTASYSVTVDGDGTELIGPVQSVALWVGGWIEIISIGTGWKVLGCYLGIRYSGSSGAYEATVGAWADVTNLSLQVTTLGGPVGIRLQSDGSGNNSMFGLFRIASDVGGNLLLLRDGTEIARHRFRLVTDAGASGNDIYFPGVFLHDDNPPGGTYTYKIQAQREQTVSAFYVHYLEMLVEPG